MSKVSISTFLILGVYLLFVSIISVQITNAQEEVRKMNPHQKEALQLFSKSPLEQQQLELTNDEAALKTLILQKLQIMQQEKKQQQQQQQETNENDIQIVNPSNAKEVKAQSLQQQQQQQENEEQNIKALELFFNTDTQQQQ